MASYIWPPSTGSGGVSSLNTLTGAVTLAAGTGITITPSGNTLTLSSADAAAIMSINTDTTAAQLIVAAATGSDFTIATSAGTTTVAIPTASASKRGLLSTADWSTFNGKQSALTIGNLTDAGTDGIVVTGGSASVIGSGTSIAQTKADATHNGYLASADWSTFNGKGAGSVTSVAFSVPASSIFAATGTPVTTTGTLGLTVTGTSGGIPFFDTASTLSTSAALTASRIVLGGGAGAAPTVLGSLGTTSTVLHGNAAGVPSFGAVALATDVSGTLAAAQFPALTGDVTTSAGALATTLAATSNATLTTLSKSTGVTVHGTNTNDDAAAGFIGEYITASVTTSTNFPASGTWGDIASIALTAGDWDVSCVFFANLVGGATTRIQFGIGTATGNSATGLVQGDTLTECLPPTSTANSGGAVPSVRKSLSGNTTIYFKVQGNWTATAPQYSGRISARRVR